MIFERTGRLIGLGEFEELLSKLYKLIGLVDLPREEMTVKTAALVEIYRKEERRAERIKREEAEAEAARERRN